MCVVCGRVWEKFALTCFMSDRLCDCMSPRVLNGCHTAFDKSLGPESHVSNNPLMACIRLLELKNDMQEINRFSTGFWAAAWQPFKQEPPPGSHCPVAARICANSSAVVRICAIPERCEPLQALPSGRAFAYAVRACRRRSRREATLVDVKHQQHV